MAMHQCIQNFPTDALVETNENATPESLYVSNDELMSEDCEVGSALSNDYIASEPISPLVSATGLLEQEAFVSALTDNICARGQTVYPDLIFTKRMGNVVEVTQNLMYHIAEAGYISIARIVFYPSINEPSLCCDIQILLTSYQKGSVSDVDQAIDFCFIISKKGDYKFCPGLDQKEYYDRYFAMIRYYLKSVRLWDRPFKRIDSVKCFLWFQLKQNAPTAEKSNQAVLCRSCKRLHSDLDYQYKRSDVSPARRLKRQHPSSTFKLKYLSPASVLKRKVSTQKQRSTDKVKLSKLAELDVTLEDDQSDEVGEIIQTIEQQCSEDLHNLFDEVDSHSLFTGKSLRDTWEWDKANCKAEFFKDQLKNGKLAYQKCKHVHFIVSSYH